MRNILKRIYLLFLILIMLFSVLSVNTNFVSAEDGNMILTNGYNGIYDLIKGKFCFKSTLDSKNNKCAVFYYSDGYFDSDPRTYNSHLATMSLNLAMSAFARGSLNKNYFNQFANVKQLLADIGCEDDNIYINRDYLDKPAFYGETGDRLSTVGVALAQKKIFLKDKAYWTLLPVVVRGSGYETEWCSNLTLGSEGEALGFSDAANQVVEEVRHYIESYGLQDDVLSGAVKFWVTGYSRAGIVANIAAKRLTDEYAKNGNDIFAYTFEAPQGGCDTEALAQSWTDNGMYCNIHNVINESDMVTMVAPVSMGFKRYGVDHYVPGNQADDVKSNVLSVGDTTVTTYFDNDKTQYAVSDDEDSLYFKQRKLMLKQLNAIDSDIEFCDDFYYATVNYLGNALFGADLIAKTDGEKVSANAFLIEFFDCLQKWALTDNYRAAYVDKRTWEKARWKNETQPEFLGFFDSDMTVQQALRFLMSLFYSKSADQRNALVLSISNTFNGLETVSSSDGTVSKFELIDLFIGRWKAFSAAEKVENGNRLLNTFFNDGADVWNNLSDTEQVQFRQALPVLIDFLLSFISEDFGYEHSAGNGSQIMLGTMIFNIETLLMAHFPEINLAWLRTYDSFYDYENISCAMDDTEPKSPLVAFDSDQRILKLQSDKGSAIYYSTDNGASWIYYQKYVELAVGIGNIQTFAIARGIESRKVTISLNDIVIAKDDNGKLNESEDLDSRQNIGYEWIWICLIAALGIGTSIFVYLKKRKLNIF